MCTFYDFFQFVSWRCPCCTKSPTVSLIRGPKLLLFTPFGHNLVPSIAPRRAFLPAPAGSTASRTDFSGRSGWQVSFHRPLGGDLGISPTVGRAKEAFHRPLGGLRGPPVTVGCGRCPGSCWQAGGPNRFS